MGRLERQNSWKMMPRVCYSHLYSGSGDVKGHTWSAPGDLQVSAQESELDPPRTEKVWQGGGVSDKRRSMNSNQVNQQEPVAGLQHRARWRCKWRDGLSLCRNTGWRSGVCQTLGGAALHVLQPLHTLARFASLLRDGHQSCPWGHKKRQTVHMSHELFTVYLSQDDC